MRPCILALVLSSLFIVGAQLQADPPKSDQPAAAKEAVAQLIQQLGSTSFVERKKAYVELEKLGPAALEQLRKACADPNPEISLRAGQLVSNFEEKLLAAAVLTPKKVHFNVKDATVTDAVAELARISGYPMQLTGDLAAFNNRKITLDTGNVSFWEAFQQLCDKAGLAEKVTLNPSAPNNAFGGPGGFGKGGGMPAPNQPSQAIQLMESKQSAPTYLSGAMKVSVLPPTKDGKTLPAGQTQLMLDVTGEPALKNFGVLGLPVIDRAIADTGDEVRTVLAPDAAPANPIGGHGIGGGPVVINNGAGNVIIINGGGKVVVNGGGVVIVNGQVISGGMFGPQVAHRVVPVQLQVAKGTKSLKELSGHMLVQALRENDVLVSVDKIDKAAGQVVKGKDGYALEIKSVKKRDDGSYEVKVALESPAGQPAGFQGGKGGFGNVNINGVNMNGIPINNNSVSPPKLRDAQGKEYAPESTTNQPMNINAGKAVQEATLIYRPAAAPAQLIQYGNHTVTFAVPFTLKNVTLP